jgi:hypothetical protein
MSLLTLLQELYLDIALYLTHRNLFNLGLSHKRAYEIL